MSAQVAAFSAVALEEASKGSRLTLLNALLAEPVADVAEVVKGLLPMGGTSGWVGKPKVGKGTMIRCLGMAVSRGDSFLGRATTRGPVFYLSFEDARDRIAGHFRAMGAQGEPLFVYTGGAPHDGIAWLTDAVWQHRPVLAILDPLGRFAKIKDFSDYGEVTAKTEPLIRLAAESGCHIAFTHHAGKTERDGGDAFLGSTALFGSVDTAVVLRRETDGTRVAESIQRYGLDLPPTVIGLDTVSGHVSAEGTRADRELETAAQGILRALEGGERDEKAIREIETSRLVPKALRQLRDDGRVLRAGTGKRGNPYTYTLSRSVVLERERTT